MRFHPTIMVPVLALGLLMPAPDAHSQSRGKFDGTWSVEVITESGDCDRAYRYPVIVQGTRVRYGGPEDFNVTGSISANGTVRGAISRGSDRADVTGRLQQDGFGSGTWKTAGSRVCGGRWNAEKRS